MSGEIKMASMEAGCYRELDQLLSDVGSGAELIGGQELPGLPHECRGKRFWADFYCFPRAQTWNWMGSGVTGS